MQLGFVFHNIHIYPYHHNCYVVCYLALCSFGVDGIALFRAPFAGPVCVDGIALFCLLRRALAALSQCFDGVVSCSRVWFGVCHSVVMCLVLYVWVWHGI